MDLDISMRTLDCDYTVQFYGALFQVGVLKSYLDDVPVSAGGGGREDSVVGSCVRFEHHEVSESASSWDAVIASVIV